MNEELFEITHEEHFKVVKEKDGIIYFEGGWWCLQDDWHEAARHRHLMELPMTDGKYYAGRNGYTISLRPNKETKQIELDRFILPTNHKK